MLEKVRSLAAEAATDPEATPLYTSLMERLVSADGAGLAAPPAPMQEGSKTRLTLTLTPTLTLTLSPLDQAHLQQSISACEAWLVLYSKVRSK